MGPAYLESFSLTSTADDGTVEGIASGTDLMTLAGQSEPETGSCYGERLT
jgi:hypothetical protein